MPLTLRDAFDRNPTDVSREFKASSYGEPSLFSGWVQSDDDFDERFRKVRFAEPPESKMIELDSVSSYAPSVDWDFRERFDPFSAKVSHFRNANQNIDKTANIAMDSLANEIDKNDLEKYFNEKSFGGFDMEDNKLPYPSNQWQTSHSLSSSSGYDTFPSTFKSEISSRITIPINYVNIKFYA